MRRFTLPNLFLTVEGEEEEEGEDGGEGGTEEEGGQAYTHKDTPRSSPRALKEGEDVIAEDNEGQASPNSPHTPASPRRGYPFLPSSHCPLHCPHKAFLAQEEGSRVATETVPEEEEEYEEEKSSDSNALDSATEAPDKEVKQLKLDEDDAPISTSNSKPVTPILAKKNARVPKSPKSPRSPMSPRYLKLFARSAVPVDTEEGSSCGLQCTCPDSCLQDGGTQEVPVRPGLVFGESLRARIDGYRRQDSTAPGVPREKRSHSLATPGSLELPGCRRGLRPDALLVRGGFVRSKFKNRHQLSVTDSFDMCDNTTGFPGTPPPQTTPPVHKDIPIMSSRLAKKFDRQSSEVHSNLTIDPLKDRKTIQITPTDDDDTEVTASQDITETSSNSTDN